MSYDIRIKRHDGTAVQLRERHNCTGGTYALGGTREAWLNVTYNYSSIFHRLLGEDGIRTIYGMNIKLPLVGGVWDMIIILVAMLLIVLLVFLIFRKKKML